jgi:ubiquitin carboxyl-terminal hydrolase 4/11/15
MIFLEYRTILVDWEVVIVLIINIDTAYVKDPLDGKWYDCDDSRVTRLDSNVMTKAAYLLFYRKRNHKEDNFAQVLKEANKLRDAELEQRKLEREQSLARPSFPTPDAPPSYSSTSWTIPASAEPTVGWQVPSAVATANNSREPSETGMDDESLRGDDFDRIEKQEADWGNDFSKVDEPINEWPVEPLEKEEDTESWQNI